MRYLIAILFIVVGPVSASAQAVRVDTPVREARLPVGAPAIAEGRDGRVDVVRKYFASAIRPNMTHKRSPTAFRLRLDGRDSALVDIEMVEWSSKYPTRGGMLLETVKLRRVGGTWVVAERLTPVHVQLRRQPPSSTPPAR